MGLQTGRLRSLNDQSMEDTMLYVLESYASSEDTRFGMVAFSTTG